MAKITQITPSTAFFSNNWSKLMSGFVAGVICNGLALVLSQSLFGVIQAPANYRLAVLVTVLVFYLILYKFKKSSSLLIPVLLIILLWNLQIEFGGDIVIGLVVSAVGGLIALVLAWVDQINPWRWRLGISLTVVILILIIKEMIWKQF